VSYAALQILDKRTGEPLAGRSVRCFAGSGRGRRLLGTEVSDGRGMLGVALARAPRGSERQGLELEVAPPKGAEGAPVKVRVRPRSGELVEVRVPARRVTAARGPGRLSDDPKAVAALRRKGFETPGAVASVPRTRFVRSTRAVLGDYEAARVHRVASAQRAYLDNLSTGVRADLADGLAQVDPGLRDVVEQARPVQCGCEDCEAAVSPLAYLADLIAYTLDHVRSGSSAMTLGKLTTLLRQPFATLPTACDEMDRRVRQVRICIEVLRRYLKAKDLPSPNSLKAIMVRGAEARYRLAAYQALLLNAGSSYEEIRRVRAADETERTQVADRIGIAVGHLDDLFLVPGEIGSITESALEDVFGLASTSKSNPLAPMGQPKLERWRVEYLRGLWRDQDLPVDLPGEGRPLVDPDVIGPDDFRNPVAKASQNAPDRPFDLWLARRQQVDALLEQQRAKREADGLDAALVEVFGDPLPELGEAAGLTPEAAARLLELRAKDAAAAAPADPTAEQVGEDEWAEVDSILVQVRKLALFGGWRDEEASIGLLAGEGVFGPAELWLSVTEPGEGAWPPELEDGVPLLDPELVKPGDLPDPTAGARARSLYEQREGELEALRSDLADSGSVGAALALALGDPPPHDLDQLAEDLRTNTDLEATRAAIEDDLHMPVEAFTRVMALRARELDEDPATFLAASEWSEVVSILGSARKVRALYAGWAAEEADPATGVPYWGALKARLPRWRGGADARSEWRQALRTRSGAPLIDPDLVVAGDIGELSPGAAVLGLWQERTDWVVSRLDQIEATREAGATPVEGLDAAIEASLGAPAGTLLALREASDAGTDVSGRLEQLSLTPAAFARLLAIRVLAAGGQPVLGAEWGEADSILCQVEKRRRVALWREEEKDVAGLMVGPPWFQVPEPPPAEFPPKAEAPLPQWRATLAERRDWLDVLQSRIDQEQAVADALEEAVSEAEEATLPMLRDTLVGATDAEGTTPEARAKWVTDRLLIDAQMGGCQTTTRVAQAIETLQNLLFSLRTNQLDDTYPGIELEAPDHDEAWTWIGSYATWRAAMFTFVYPENILVPTLRRWQTPGFRELVAGLRSGRRVTAGQARAAAEGYSAYLRDVSRLEVEATCQARTRLRTPDPGEKATGYSTLLHMYGRAESRVYFSHFDPGDPVPSAYAQAFWEEVPGLGRVKEVIGAVPYEVTGEERYVYLFAIASEKRTSKLVFSRYDLEARTWDAEPTELELPEGATSFQAVVRQATGASAPPALVVRAPSGRLFRRRLNQDGTDWSGDAWSPFRGRQKPTLEDPDRPIRFARLLAQVEVNSAEYYMFAAEDDGEVWYRIFGDSDDGRWRELGATSFVGAFQWPGSEEVYVLADFGGGSRCAVLALNNLGATQGNPAEMTSTEAVRIVNRWLIEVGGVDLQMHKLESDSTLHPGQPLLRVLEARDPEGQHFLNLGLLFGKSVTAQLWRWYQRLLIDEFCRDIEATEDRLDEKLGDWAIANAMAGRFRPFGAESIRAALRLALPSDATDPPEPLPQEDNDPVSIVSVELDGPSSIDSLAVHMSDAVRPPAVAFGRRAVAVGAFRATLARGDDDGIAMHWQTPVTPLLSGPYDIPDRASEKGLQLRREASAAAFVANWTNSQANLAYLKEAFYFVPIVLGMELQARGLYTEALDWFRLAYDYTAPLADRKVYYGLELEETASAAYSRAEDWLLDPLNPHQIAETRQNAYTRFTLLTIIRALLDFADSEFTRDTAESIPLARTLYMTALELLDSPHLAQRLGICTDKIGELEIDLADRAWQSAWRSAASRLRALGTPARLNAVVDALNATLGGGGDDDAAAAFFEGSRLISEALAGEPPERSLGALVEADRAAGEAVRTAIAAHPEVARAQERVGGAVARDHLASVSLVSGARAEALEAGDADVRWLGGKRRAASGGGRARSTAGTQRDDASRARRADPLGRTTGSRLGSLAAQRPADALSVVERLPTWFATVPSYEFCIPPNPILKALRLRAEVNLFKIRSCRNIAGMERQLDPYAAPTDTESGLPVIGAGGNLVLPGLATLAPTPYRYSFLVERAKQLVGLAQQAEGSMLSSIEKADAERYGLLRARQDVKLSRAGVQLQTLRVKEAEGGIELAKLQQERAQIEADELDRWLAEGENSYEQLALELMRAAALADAIAAATAFATPGGAASGFQALAGGLSVASGWAAMQASFERREEEWGLRRDLALQDVKIGAQHVKIAEDRVRVVAQERAIAELQHENAEDVVQFLATKFSNAELYEWMSGVLEGVYGHLLQQATAMAQLAASQLAFERQEPPPPFVQADYWLPEAAPGAADDGEAPDRRGLTGAARLLADIAKLEQHAFETNERKLNLTKTISLAQLAPVELQRFRETGVISFETPMQLFERDFPEHYLRLVNRVRTSVVALAPTTAGIRATLTSSRVSRVVIGGDIFQKVQVQHGPDRVALSSAREATGVFELDPQAEMLRPFEGIGVDAAWELRMPRAANPSLDYRAIADVLLTIDYTALSSYDYGQQVVQTMKPTVSADRALSFRHHFPDQWYDLHNPDQTDTPMVVRFATRRSDFPPNLDRIKIQHVVVFFARAAGQSFEVPITHLRFTEEDGAGAVGGGSASVEGIVSTRRGNAGSWMPMIGRRAVGEWELALPTSDDVRGRFRREEIEDILLVVTYSGVAPDWPS
jgi:hypothetical protein